MHGVAAVHVSRFLQGLGNALEVLAQHVDVQAVLEPHAGGAHQRVRHHRTAQVQRASRQELEDTEYIKLREIRVQGGLHGLGRNDDQQHHAGEPEVLQRETVSGEAVAHQRAGDHLQNRYQQARPHRVDHGFGEGSQVEHDAVVIQRHVAGQQHDGGIVQVLFFHQTGAQTGEHGLDDHEAQAEEQQAADQGNGQLLGLGLHQIAARPLVGRLEGGFSLHSNAPPWK